MRRVASWRVGRRMLGDKRLNGGRSYASLQKKLRRSSSLPATVAGVYGTVRRFRFWTELRSAIRMQGSGYGGQSNECSNAERLRQSRSVASDPLQQRHGLCDRQPGGPRELARSSRVNGFIAGDRCVSGKREGLGKSPSGRGGI